MRISTQQIYDTGLQNMQDASSTLLNTQQQISTGVRIQSPADDPVASTRILQINQELALISQYQRNIDIADNRLSLEDSLLNSTVGAVQRLRELVIQAGDGALNEDDRTYIAAEVDQIHSQLTGILNTKDPSGEYVFGGFQGNVAPFSANEAGNFVYQGDEGRRFLQVDSNVSVAVSDNGKDIFVTVPSAQNTFNTSASPRNTSEPPAIITQGLVVTQEDYDAFYPEDIQVVFNAETDVVPPAPNYTITRVSDGRPLLSNQLYATGAAISVEGIQFEIIGEPRPGDVFFANSSDTQSLLTTIERFSQSLKDYSDSPAGREVFQERLDATLANLTNAETKILEARSSLGARQNTLETTRSVHENVTLLTKEVLSELQDTDFAEATSNLTLQETILEAAQLSFTRVTRLSMFQFL